MLKPVNKPLGTEAMVWQPLRDGDVVPEHGAHSNLADAVPILTGVVEDEFVMFESFMPKMKTNTEVLASIVEGMRGYFLTTNLAEQSGDGDKWTEHANRLYDIVEAGRKDRGL